MNANKSNDEEKRRLSDPRFNVLIPRDDTSAVNPPELSPDYEESRARPGNTIPELIERLEVCRLRFGADLCLQRLGDCTQIFKGRKVVELEDLEASELKDLREALLKETV